MKQSRVAMISTGISGLCCLVALGVAANDKLQAKQATELEAKRFQQEQSSRSQALETIAKEHQREGCWFLNGDFYIGRRILPTAQNSFPPTTCLANQDKTPSQFYAYITRVNDVMQMKYVFTSKELQNQLSKLK